MEDNEKNKVNHEGSIIISRKKRVNDEVLQLIIKCARREIVSAKAPAVFYSLAETAKANKRNIEEYFTEILSQKHRFIF